ncbi:MAG: SDR family oxidoreductase [Candidatus Woesearchaeota archaeon]
MKKRFLVSGGTRGIGRAIVDEALSRGNYVSTFSSREKSVNSLRKDFSRELEMGYLLVDHSHVNDYEKVSSIVERQKEKQGGIDVCVINAGIGYYSLAHNACLSKVEEMFRVNTFGAMNVVKQTIPVMKSQQSGVVLYIDSAPSKDSNPFTSFYAASKEATRIFLEGVKQEVIPYNIKIINLNIGMTDTSFLTTPGTLPNELQTFTKLCERGLQTKEIADMVLNLTVSDSDIYCSTLTMQPFGLLKDLISHRNKGLEGIYKK